VRNNDVNTRARIEAERQNGQARWADKSDSSGVGVCFAYRCRKNQGTKALRRSYKAQGEKLSPAQHILCVLESLKFHCFQR